MVFRIQQHLYPPPNLPSPALPPQAPIAASLAQALSSSSSPLISFAAPLPLRLVLVWPLHVLQSHRSQPNYNMPQVNERT